MLLGSVHQHDAPVADLVAERLLRTHKAGASVCDLEFHERAVRKTADALREGLTRSRSVTHVGLGMAQVEMVVNEPVRLVAVVTRDAVEDLGLKTGMATTAIVKSTSVMVQSFAK